MIIPYYIYAGLNAVIWSLLLVFYRFVMKRGANPKALMIFGQLGALLILIICNGIPEYSTYSKISLMLLVTSGLLWALGVFLEISALEYLEASSSGIISAARYILSFLAGVVILQESLTTARFLGVLLIVAAIIGISEFKRLSFRKGFWINLASTFFQVGAYAIDKHLSQVLPATAIATSSFILPGFVFLCLYPRAVLQIGEEYRRSAHILPLLPAGLACCYMAVVKAFSMADFIAVLAIAESALIFTCFFAYWFLGERENLARKLICSGICAAGVVLVCTQGS